MDDTTTPVKWKMESEALRPDSDIAKTLLVSWKCALWSDPDRQRLAKMLSDLEDHYPRLAELNTACEQEGFSLLSVAASMGRDVMCRHLINSEVNVEFHGILNGPDPLWAGRGAALYVAAAAGHLEVVQLLVEQGARLDAKGTMRMWNGSTYVMVEDRPPYDVAQAFSHPQVADFLKARESHTD